MRRSIIALVIGAALAAGGAVALPAPADALPGRPYYSLPFTDALVYTARFPDRGAAFATVEQWQADGSPVPTPATVAYPVLPWDSTVYADVNVGITDFGVALDAAQWRRAGSPAPTRGVLPEASEIWQHPGSDELLVRTRYGWDRHSAVWHTMTFPEWRTLGFPPVDRRGEHVYERLSWLETVVARRDRGGSTRTASPSTSGRRRADRRLASSPRSPATGTARCRGARRSATSASRSPTASRCPSNGGSPRARRRRPAPADASGYFAFFSVSPESAAMNASWGTSTRPTIFMRFLPSFCFSRSLRLRVMSPP